MKSQLCLAVHSSVPGTMICEIWHKGQFIGQVVGADGPGVRILAKHPITQTRVDEQTLELQIEPKQLHKSV